MNYNEADIARLREAVEMSAISGDSAQPLGGPFGAVIYKDGRCIAKGFNHVLAENDPTAHAEVWTIRQACAALNSFDLSGCTLYSSCEPCPMCLMSAKWANIDKIFFAAGRKDAAAIGFRDNELYQLLKDGVYAEAIPECRDEAVRIMQLWHQKFGSDKGY